MSIERVMKAAKPTPAIFHMLEDASQEDSGAAISLRTPILSPILDYGCERVSGDDEGTFRAPRDGLGHSIVRKKVITAANAGRPNGVKHGKVGRFFQ